MKTARPGKLKRQEEQASFISWRFALLCGCILLALVGLIMRTAYLQVINPDKLVREGICARCEYKRCRRRVA